MSSWRDEAIPVDASAGSWRSEAVPVPPDEARPSGEAGLASRLGSLAGRAAIYGLKKLDSVTGAPTRSALRAMQLSNGDIAEAGEAFAEQFGEDPDTAPTGKDIAKGFGITDERPMSERFPSLYTDEKGFWDKGLKLTKGGPLDFSPAGAAGFGVDVGADPTNLFPPKLLGTALSKGALKAGQSIEDFAKLRAVKQGGAATLGDFRQLVRTKKLHPAGEFALEEKIVTPLASFDDVAERTAASRAKYGKMLGDFEDALDSRFEDIANSNLRDALFNPKRVADRIDSELLSKLRGSIAFDDVVPGLEKRVELLRQMGDRPIPYGQARQLKTDLDAVIPWGKKSIELSPAEKKLIELRGIINDEIDRGVEQITKATTAPEAFAQYKEAKRRYGLSDTLDKMAKDRKLRDEANRFVSATDYLAGGAGLAGGLASGQDKTDTAAMSLGLAALNRFGRKYGNALSATGARRIGQAVTAAGKALPAAAGAVKAGYQVGMGAVRNQSQPLDVLGRAKANPAAAKFLPLLEDAASRGNDSLKTRHFLLMQTDPEYRKAFREGEGDEQ